MSSIISNVSDVFGVYSRLEFIDLVELEGVKYVLLLPLLGEEEVREVVILAVGEKYADSLTGLYVSVKGADVLAHVYALFAQRNTGVLDPTCAV